MKKKKRTELMPDYSTPIKQRKPNKTEYRKRQDKIDKSVRDKYLSQTGLDELHAAKAMKEKIADIDAKADKTADRMAREILKPMNDEAKEERKLNRAAVAAMRKALKEQKREEHIEARADKKARDILKRLGISQASNNGNFTGLVNESIIKDKTGRYENKLGLPQADWEEMVREDVAATMQTNYTDWVTKLQSDYAGATVAKESKYLPADQRVPENRETVSATTIEELKKQEYMLNRLNALPSAEEFVKLGRDEQTEYYKRAQEVKEYFDYIESDEYQESEVKFKSDMEIARSRMLNSKSVPEIIKDYIRKGDLQTVKDFSDFIANAKARTGRAKDQYYWDNLLPADMQDEIDTIAKLARNDEEQQFLSFIAFRISQPYVDGDIKNKILYQATFVRNSRGNRVYKLGSLEGYF